MPAIVSSANAAPRTRSSRRWLRYSVRSMLALVTVLCVFLAIATHKAGIQRRAVAAVKIDFGRVVYDFQETEGFWSNDRAESPIPAWIRDTLGIDLFHNVVGVELSSPAVTDDTLQQLAALPHLKHLYIADQQLSTAVLGHLAKFKCLQGLSLSAAQFQTTAVTDT